MAVCTLDWLVGEGAHAQFKGWETISGAGKHALMLTAGNGQLPGGDRTAGSKYLGGNLRHQHLRQPVRHGGQGPRGERRHGGVPLRFTCFEDQFSFSEVLIIHRKNIPMRPLAGKWAGYDAIGSGLRGRLAQN